MYEGNTEKEKDRQRDADTETDRQTRHLTHLCGLSYHVTSPVIEFLLVGDQ